MKLLIVAGEGRGEKFSIEEGNNLIGRWDPQSVAFPEIDLTDHDSEAKISRRHAVIERDSDRLAIEDVGSLNGTFLNGAKLELGKLQPLKVGDELEIGASIFKVVAE